MISTLTDTFIILFFIICFLSGRYIARILIYRYYPQVELRINKTAIKKITQKEADRIIQKAKDNPY